MFHACQLLTRLVRVRKLTSVNVRLYSIHHCIAACGVSLPKVKAAAGVFTVLSQYGAPDSGKSLGQKIALSHYGAYRESTDANEMNKILLFNGKTRSEVIKSAVSFCRGMVICDALLR